MDLNNIKVGDNVFVKKEVIYGLARSKTFKIPIKVTRLTKTLVICEDGTRYKKENGVVVNSGCTRRYANLEGPDETKEMEAFQKHVDKFNKARCLLGDLSMLSNKLPIELEDEVLDKAIDLVEYLKDRVNEKKGE